MSSKPGQRPAESDRGGSTGSPGTGRARLPGSRSTRHDWAIRALFEEVTERCGGAALADAQGQPTREFSLFLARYSWESVRDRTLDRDFETMVESAVFAASTREILPLCFAGACPMRLAW